MTSYICAPNKEILGGPLCAKPLVTTGNGGLTDEVLLVYQFFVREFSQSLFFPNSKKKEIFFWDILHETGKKIEATKHFMDYYNP